MVSSFILLKISKSTKYSKLIYALTNREKGINAKKKNDNELWVLLLKKERFLVTKSKHIKII